VQNRANVAGAADNVFNLRTHHFGIDICFDGAFFQISAWYKMVNGSAEDLSLLRATAGCCYCLQPISYFDHDHLKLNLILLVIL
jgi:hypothetical protein